MMKTACKKLTGQDDVESWVMSLRREKYIR